MNLVSVKKSTVSGKKFTATFTMSNGKKKQVHFGATGYTDYTLSGDKTKRKNYRARHAKEKSQAADTPGALAYHILWGESTSRTENIKAFKRKYGV